MLEQRKMLSLLTQVVRFLSKTPVYEVSILTCINFLQCSRVVFSICLNSNFTALTTHRLPPLKYKPRFQL